MGDRIPFAKILIACVAVLLVSFVIWTVSSTLPTPFGPNPYEKFDWGLIGNGAFVFALISVAGFVVSAFAWIVMGVISNLRGRYAEPQLLFSKEYKESQPRG
jgi:hypothetical protein